MIRTLATLLMLAALSMTGCFSPDRKADPKLAAELSPLPYPGEAKAGPDLDIVVTRNGDHIRLTNRTPRTYDDVQLWINQQYVAKVGSIRIGPESTVLSDVNRLSLKRFVNKYGEAYPKGGFLAPERDYPVVLVELFDPATALKHRLLVQMKR